VAVTVHTTTTEGLRVESRVGTHLVIADEPETAGGSDAGPSAVDLLMTALGSCTAVTLTMVAKRKGWPLEAVDVAVRFARIDKADCTDCPPDHPKDRIDRIERHVEMTGALTDEQVAYLHDIAMKCPVHRIMTGPPVIVTTSARRG
jgi:putative redox protein